MKRKIGRRCKKLKQSSLIASRMSVSSTSALTDLVDKLVSEGVDVISLGAGEPDFPTPEHISAAAIKAIRDGQTRYTATGGIAQLKEAIRRKFLRENGLTYTADEVIASAGGKQIIFSALMATLRDEDEVVIPAPLLGELSRYRQNVWGNAGYRRNQPPKRFQTDRRPDPHRANGPDPLVDAELALQPLWRGAWCR